MRTTVTLLCLLLAAPAVGQVGWNGSILEIDCRGVESVSGTVAKERRCMEIAANRALGEDTLLCTATTRDNGRCPPSIPFDEDFPKIRWQDCTDRDIPGDRGRCLYGRGPGTFDITGCTAKNAPVSCCSGSGAGSCPALPTCNEAEWGHISRDLETGADSWCDGSSWTATTIQEVQDGWHPSLFEGANRISIVSLPTCDATIEGGAYVVTDGDGAADCDPAVPNGSNAHRCRCLSTVWTAETGEYQIWPPSSSLFGVNAVGDLPPCTASTNNLRAWIGPFGDPRRPWLDGTLYRCSNPTWAANVGNYRVSENDDGLGDIARPWCRDENCFFAAPPDAANAWIEDEGQDLIKRQQDTTFENRADAGQAKIRSQQESTEAN